MGREPVSREELLDSYRSPYRRWLPFALMGYGVHYLAALTVLLGVVGGIGAAVGAGFAGTVLGLALAGVVAVAAVAAWATVVGVRLIRERTWAWRPDDEDDLARVRERRPHRGEADPEIAHVEYAVSVEEGRLVTWAFEPLLAGDEWDDETVLIRGVPLYEARAVEHLIHEGPAGELLVEAQEHAAALEADEIVRARLELEHDAAARELTLSSRRAGAS